MRDQRAQLHFGDCQTLIQHMPADAFDVVITDPPYGINLKAHDATGRTRRLTRKIAGDVSGELGAAVLAMLAKYPRVAFANPMRPWPGPWRQFLVWNKGAGVGGGGDIATTWKQTWELIQVAGTSKLNGQRDGAVLDYPISSNDYATHPAAKPVALLKYLICKVTRPGQVVFDPFMGAGPVGVAAIETGRRFIGCEIDGAHYATASARIERAQAQGLLPLKTL